MSMPAANGVVQETPRASPRAPTSLPRNENETLLTPPEIFAPGQTSLDLPRGLEEIDRVAVVLFDARGDGQDVRIEDDVLGRHADLLGQQLVGPLGRCAPCRRLSVACPCSSKAITTTAAP